MPQNNEIAPHEERRYTRADFAALRASLNRLDIRFIAQNYYSEPDLEELDCQTPAQLQGRLDDMRDHLIARASVANPHAAEALRHARKSAKWSRVAMDFLFRAAEFQSTRPLPDDALTAWFKPRVARHLMNEGILTLGQLVRLIEGRGPTWWKPIPRLGEGKAKSILAWLKRHDSLGEITVTGTLLRSEQTPPLAPVVLDPARPVLAPIEAIRLPAELDGSRGLNRATQFSLIYARNDLEALESYLVKFREQAHTLRSYRKELERLLLWAIHKEGKALSSLLVEDCERYKAFLAQPDPDWVGGRVPRWSKRWKPFEGPLSDASRQHAITVIRRFFSWLQDVRYIAGNPWVGVSNPLKETFETALQIDKALPEDIWKSLTQAGGYLDEAIRHTKPAIQKQLRAGKAAILLVGTTGIRREEACRATRGRLKALANNKAGLAELAVLGKGRKWRTVLLPHTALQALREHWMDRGEDFDDPGKGEHHLLSPLVIPPTETATQKHDQQVAPGYQASALWQLIKTTLKRVADDPQIEMPDHERRALKERATHAFRHTFASIGVAKGVPLDVMKGILGHASLETTSIYVQAERKRSIEEMTKFFDEG